MKIEDFPIPLKPDSYQEPIKFPEDLPSTDIDVVGKLLSRIGAYRGYTLYLLSLSQSKLKMLENEYNLVVAEESNKIEDRKNRTQKSVKEEVSMLPRVLEAGRKMIASERDVIFLTSLRDIYNGYIEILSREISRRGMDR